MCQQDQLRRFGILWSSRWRMLGFGAGQVREDESEGGREPRISLGKLPRTFKRDLGNVGGDWLRLGIRHRVRVVPAMVVPAMVMPAMVMPACVRVTVLMRGMRMNPDDVMGMWMTQT